MTETNAGPLTGDDHVAATIERIETSWHGLLAALAGVPDDRLAEPGAVGEWAVKDVMGHVAYWDGQAVVAAQRFLAGQAQPKVDWQVINERETAAHRDRSVAEQRAAMERAHAALLDLLRTTPPTDPRVVGLCGCLQGDTFEHYDEHAADVRAWRARAGL